MMDNQLLSMLGRALHDLERYAPGLDDLLVPSRGGGGSAGRGGSRRGSKPPVSISMLDVKIETQGVLDRWVAQVLHTHPGLSGPGVGSISRAAAWINTHLSVIADAQWGAMCADEVIATASLVVDLVAPPATDTDPEPISSGTVRQVVGWAGVLGRSVTRRSVYRWVERGEIPARLDVNQRVIVWLEDVLAKCDELRFSQLSQQ